MNATNLLLPVATLTALLSTAVFAQTESEEPMTFFVTGESHSGDLGGLDGADAICQGLAADVGAGGHTWRAYLSTHGAGSVPAVNARDRIGNGPWHNAKGVLIAASLADLHGDIQRDSNLIYRETALTEKGELVNGRVRPEGTNNEHDMLTGSDSHGRAFSAGASRNTNYTCDNWTSGSDEGSAMIGHHDRVSSWNTSWNSSHATNGCSLEILNETGGAGRFYCFAEDN
jgi:hypothetical protein